MWSNHLFRNVLCMYSQPVLFSNYYSFSSVDYARNRIKIILDYVLRGFDFNISKEKNDYFNNWLKSDAVLVLLAKLYEKVNDTYLSKEISFYLYPVT